MSTAGASPAPAGFAAAGSAAPASATTAPANLSEDQTAALQEIANIGMGQAGDSIARIWKQFVALSVPRIALVESGRIPTLIHHFVGDARVSAARQAFHGAMRGEVLVVIGRGNRDQLGELMGYDGQLDLGEEQEMLLDIANVLGGACIGGIARQLGADVGFSAPSLIGTDLDSHAVVRPEELCVSTALCVEVCFTIESNQLSAHLIALMPREELVNLAQLLDRFLCNL